MTHRNAPLGRKAAALLAAGALVAMSAASAFGHRGAPTSAPEARPILPAAERFGADESEADVLNAIETDEPEVEAPDETDELNAVGTDETDEPDREITPHHAAEDVEDDQGEDEDEAGEDGDDQGEDEDEAGEDGEHEDESDDGGEHESDD